MRRRKIKGEVLASSDQFGSLLLQHALRTVGWLKMFFEHRGKVRHPKRRCERCDYNAATDEKLVQIYLSRSSSVEEVVLAYKVYKKRHGVPIYLDIAVDITDKLLRQQVDPRYEDVKVQEELLRTAISEILRQAKNRNVLKN